MRLTDRALGRALLARQGLLQAAIGSVVPVVESIGALQAQYWPSIPVALWSRMAAFPVDDLHRALADRELVLGTLLRRTLHLVSRAEHPAYAAVADGSGLIQPTRLLTPTPATEALYAEVLRYAAQPRTLTELGELIERRIAERPAGLDLAEMDRQRTMKFRPLITTTRLVRVPRDGAWNDRTPSAYQAIDVPDLDPAQALDEVARRYLRAFGPAGADDFAAWIGWPVPPVRAALDRLDALRLTDQTGRALYDLPDAPRPEADVPAPVRFLPAFDSALLAYAPKRRSRILPDGHRARVYVSANLKWLPTFLVDGLVAGTWADALKRREAVITLTVFDRLPRAAMAALRTQAEKLILFRHPTASTHHVELG